MKGKLEPELTRSKSMLGHPLVDSLAHAMPGVICPVVDRNNQQWQGLRDIAFDTDHNLVPDADAQGHDEMPDFTYNRIWPLPSTPNLSKSYISPINTKNLASLQHG